MQDNLEEKRENNHVDFNEIPGPEAAEMMGTGGLLLQEKPAGGDGENGDNKQKEPTRSENKTTGVGISDAELDNKKLTAVTAQLKDLQPAPEDPEEKRDLETFELPKEAIAPIPGRLSRLRKIVTGDTEKDLEKMGELFYTQEGLLRLVKKAEKRTKPDAANEIHEENPLSEPTQDTDITDIAAFTEEDLEANELQFSKLIEKENKGERLTNDEVGELIQWWKIRGEIEKSLVSQHKQSSNRESKKVNKMIDILDRSLKKAWKSFTARSDDGNSSLKELVTIAHMKAKKSGKTDFSIPKGTSPSAVAAMITQMQIDAQGKTTAASQP